jgi:hypothetical protein
MQMLEELKKEGNALRQSKPHVSFNNTKTTTTVYNPNTPPSSLQTSIIGTAQQVVNAAQQTVHTAKQIPLATNAGTATVNPPANSNAKSVTGQATQIIKDPNETPSEIAEKPVKEATIPVETDESNESTEEPEIKSITIYNKTFLVETKVEDPLTEEQTRLANHLYLCEFEGKDDEWRRTVLKEVIEGCIGDFSVTVGAQCHAFRSYLEELAQKVFDEDKPILWEGAEETKENGTSGTKKKKTIRKEEGKGDGKDEGKEEGDKEYEITISISLSDLRTLLTSMNKSMTLNEAKGIADEQD